MQEIRSQIQKATNTAVMVTKRGVQDLNAQAEQLSLVVEQYAVS